MSTNATGFFSEPAIVFEMHYCKEIRLIRANFLRVLSVEFASDVEFAG